MNTEFFLLTLHQIYLKDNNKQKKIITNNILIENKSFGILSSINNNSVNLNLLLGKQQNLKSKLVKFFKNLDNFFLIIIYLKDKLDIDASFINKKIYI